MLPADAAKDRGAGYHIGVDVGGTKILAVATGVAEPALVLGEEEVPTFDALDHSPLAPSGGGAASVKVRIDAVVGRLRAQRPAERLKGIGVGLPGLVTRDGVLRYGPNVPGVVELDLARWLGDRHGVPVAVDNDGNCAALAEFHLGAGRPLSGSADAQPMVFVGLGTGISCGLVLGGQLLRGVNGFAGEAGHMVVQGNGARCACGRTGCWEALACGPALARQARAAARGGAAPWLLAAVGGDPEAIEGHHVSEGLVHGDPGVRRVAAAFADHVAVGLVNLAHLLDPAMIVLGGSVLSDAAPWMELIGGAYRRRVMQPEMRAATRLAAATMGRRAGAIGAALLGASVPP